MLPKNGEENMSRIMLFAGAIAIGAAYFGSNADEFVTAFKNARNAEPSASVAPPNSTASTPEQVSLGPSGSEILKADQRGHFLANFKVNGRNISGLVDTGATFVAMNERTARKVGISISGLDFIYAVNTANGKTEAAHINLNRMELGSIRVRDVEAFVLRDNSLGDTILVGMSFMRKLESFKIEGDALYLKN